MGQIGDNTGSAFGTGQLDLVGLVAGDVITSANNNDIQKILIQIETILGATVYGAFGSVQDRLNDIDAQLTTLTAENFSVVDTAQGSLSAGVGVEADLMTLAIPAATLAVGDGLEFGFTGLATLDDLGDVTHYIRIDTTNHITLTQSHSNSSLEVNPWRLVGSLFVRSTSQVVIMTTLHFAQGSAAPSAATRHETLVISDDLTQAFNLIHRAERAATDTVFSVESGYVRRIPAS